MRRCDTYGAAILPGRRTLDTADRGFSGSSCQSSCDPTKAVAPGKPLTGLAGIGAGAVPGEIGKDAQGPRLADQGDTFGHVAAMSLGDEPQRGLVLLDIFQVDPEAVLTELAALVAHG